jgi:HEAT repeat protein
MEVTFEVVRQALQADEPRYRQLAAELGTDALQHLQKLIASEDSMLASKAAYLAGVIGSDAAIPILQQAAASADVKVRVAAAAAAAWLPSANASDVLASLVDDADVGVQKVALRSVPQTPSDYLMGRVKWLSSGDASEVVKKESAAAIARAKKQ